MKTVLNFALISMNIVNFKIYYEDKYDKQILSKYNYR